MATVKRAKPSTATNPPAPSTLLIKIRERTKLEDSLLSKEARTRRESERLLRNLPMVFDQVHLYFATKKIRSLPVESLVQALVESSSKQNLQPGQALKALNKLQEYIPEYCSLKDGRFLIKEVKRTTATVPNLASAPPIISTTTELQDSTGKWRKIVVDSSIQELESLKDVLQPQM